MEHTLSQLLPGANKVLNALISRVSSSKSCSCLSTSSVHCLVVCDARYWTLHAITIQVTIEERADLRSFYLCLCTTAETKLCQSTQYSDWAWREIQAESIAPESTTRKNARPRTWCLFERCRASSQTVCQFERGRAPKSGARPIIGSLANCWILTWNLLIQHTLSRWCSSDCVHEGCGNVNHWLQTEDQLHWIFFYRHPGRQASTACLHSSTWPHWNTLNFQMQFSPQPLNFMNCCIDMLDPDFSLAAWVVSKCPHRGQMPHPRPLCTKGGEGCVGLCWPSWGRVESSSCAHKGRGEVAGKVA